MGPGGLQRGLYRPFQLQLIFVVHSGDLRVVMGETWYAGV